MTAAPLKGTPRRPRSVMTFLLLVIVAALAAVLGYVAGSRSRPPRNAPVTLAEPTATALPEASPMPAAPPQASPPASDFGEEKARLIRSRDDECAALRNDLAASDARLSGLEALARERERLFGELADTRAETARYRQIVIDIENNAPPPILAGIGEPDDLKLIVGVGPVLERMLHNLGITTFRQIARWTEREVAEFDARLPEFPGRIQRDQWVTQARALHESKYGQSVPGLPG
jgi:predicted flap endonuclease-1-like 5' DNA nuclease